MTTLKVLKYGFDKGLGRAARILKGAPESRRRAGSLTGLGKSSVRLVLQILLIPICLPLPYRFMRNLYSISRSAGLISGFAKRTKR